MRRWRLDKESGIPIQDDQGPIFEYTEAEHVRAHKNAVALEWIASVLPREDEWQSACGTIEFIADTLDNLEVPRPTHYPEGTDIR